eukprot:TRINITY_DN5943_c1_g1_i1.p1 TRINITY_DN5943_c1_g1~~TRINITY_DN5943_c1_g1_i1.p1  ORF type:complete len:401 (+),score=39.22 TRINITY_DN5943_c1_g1_i1:35-1204(+)
MQRITRVLLAILGILLLTLHGVKWTTSQGGIKRVARSLGENWLNGPGSEELRRRTMQNMKKATRIPDLTKISFDLHGAGVVPNALTKNEVRKIKKMVLENFLNTPQDLYGDINTRHHRYDVPVSINNTLARTTLCNTARKMKSFITEVFGPTPVIAELSSLLVFHGAMAQDIHRDTYEDETEVYGYDNPGPSPLASFFTPLVNITNNVGGTELWPFTASERTVLPVDLVKHSHIGEECPIEREAPGMTTNTGCYLGMLPYLSAGSVLAMDSRQYHRSTSHTNTYNLVRPVFYFSLLSPDLPLPLGSTYTRTFKSPVLLWDVCNNTTATHVEPPTEEELDALIYRAVWLDRMLTLQDFVFGWWDTVGGLLCCAVVFYAVVRKVKVVDKLE